MDTLSSIHMSERRYKDLREACQHFIHKWDGVPDRKRARLDVIKELTELDLRYEQAVNSGYQTVVKGISYEPMPDLKQVERVCFWLALGLFTLTVIVNKPNASQ